MAYLFLKQMEAELEAQLSNALASMETELRKCHVSEIGQTLVYLHHISAETVSDNFIWDWCEICIIFCINKRDRTHVV